MKKYTAWRKAWELGRMGLAVCYITECIIIIILKTN